MTPVTPKAVDAVSAIAYSRGPLAEPCPPQSQARSARASLFLAPRSLLPASPPALLIGQRSLLRSSRHAARLPSVLLHPTRPAAGLPAGAEGQPMSHFPFMAERWRISVSVLAREALRMAQGRTGAAVKTFPAGELAQSLERFLEDTLRPMLQNLHPKALSLTSDDWQQVASTVRSGIRCTVALRQPSGETAEIAVQIEPVQP